jgi:hypothetical protein
MEHFVKKYLLKNRYSLLGSVIACFICVVIVEGIVMDRESRVYSFDNPFFELNLNNIEELQFQRSRNR